eukprot:10706541-Alexandrium_andersonii.AAC.1
MARQQVQLQCELLPPRFAPEVCPRRLSLAARPMASAATLARRCRCAASAALRRGGHANKLDAL